MCTAPEPAPRSLSAYEIGGFRLLLDSFPFHESEYLAAFRTEDRQDPDLRLTVRQVPSLPFPDGVETALTGETLFLDRSGRRVRVCRTEQKSSILYRVTELKPGELLAEIIPAAAGQLGSYLILRWLDLPRAFLERDAVFLHASFVCWQGKAILFTGQKQIGKSTQAELWRSCRNARVLNGDRALLRRIDGVWTGCGSPFCGTSDICVNEKIPVAAIVLLKQGPENLALPVPLKSAYVAFLSGCTYNPGDRDEMDRVIALTEQIYAQVPMFRLTCTPDEGAVLCLEAALKEAGIYG